MKIIITAVTICLTLFAGVVLAWITYLNFPVSGESIVTLPMENQRQISRLGPEPRVRLTAVNQVILESPVYFDVRILPWFRQAKIDLVYQESGQLLDGLALQSAAGWNYNLKKPDRVEELSDGWSRATFTFDLVGGYQVRNIRRFLISTHQTDTTARGNLILQSLRLQLLR